MTPPAPKLQDQVACITGGGSGIGAEIARSFASEGADIALLDVDDEAAAQVAAEIRAAGGQARTYHTDVADEAQVHDTIATLRHDFGRIDIAVNSAIRMAPGSLIDLPLENWRRLLDVGLTGTFLVSQTAAAAMIAQGDGGAIINLSSVGGLAPYPGTGAYSTCKAALIMFSKQAALEWAPHRIRVNAICPGHVETPLTAYLKDPEIRQAREDVTPLGRVGQPHDIAAAALYLASSDASWVTGSALVVDGGMTDSIFNHIPGRKWRD